MIDVAQPAPDLGRHVERRSQQAAGLAVSHALGEIGDAKIEQLDHRIWRRGGHEDAVALEPAMDHAFVVHGLQRACHLAADVGQGRDFADVLKLAEGCRKRSAWQVFQT